MQSFSRGSLIYVNIIYIG